MHYLHKIFQYSAPSVSLFISNNLKLKRKKIKNIYINLFKYNTIHKNDLKRFFKKSFVVRANKDNNTSHSFKKSCILCKEYFFQVKIILISLKSIM